MKKAIIRRLIIAAGWLAVITLLSWRWQWELIGWWIGGLIGIFLLEADHLLYVYLVQPEALTSQRVKKYLSAGQWEPAVSLLQNTIDERRKLPLHNFLFQVVLWILGFFVVTSTDSLLGQGLVLAMGLDFLAWEWQSLLGGRGEALRYQLFWLIGEPPTRSQQKALVITATLLFVVVNLLLM